MWKISITEPSEELWTDFREFEAYEDGLKFLKSTKTDRNHTFLFWNGPTPENGEEQQDIADKVLNANEGRVTSIMLGATITIEPHESRFNWCGSPIGGCYCVKYVHQTFGRCIRLHRMGSDGGFTLFLDCGNQCGGPIP